MTHLNLLDALSTHCGLVKPNLTNQLHAGLRPLILKKTSNFSYFLQWKIFKWSKNHIGIWKFYWAELEYIWELSQYNTDGLVQDCSISTANTMEILQSCTKPLIYILPCQYEFPKILQWLYSNQIFHCKSSQISRPWVCRLKCSYRWVSARLQHLHCISSGGTAKWLENSKHWSHTFQGFAIS